MPRILFSALLLLISAAAVAAGAHTADARGGHVHPGAHGVAAASPAGGWNTDAALRTGMGRIRRSVDALEHYRHGHIGPDQALVLARSIEKDVAAIVATCKLDPAADAALHAIIAKLMRGAAALRAHPADLAAIEPMREALAEYGRSFDDPDFRAPAR